jgi:uncharacterized protein YbcI
LDTEQEPTPIHPPSPAMDISNSAVQILRRYAGRGPVKAKTYINGDLVTVVMADTLTTAEQTMVNSGEWPHVELTRLKLQGIMQDALVETVEKHTGRKVIAFTSANHRDPDLGIENFVLAPGAS